MASVPFVGTLARITKVIATKNLGRYIAITFIHIRLFMPVSKRFLSVCSPSMERKPRKEADRRLRHDFPFFSGELLEDNFQGPWSLDVATKYAKQKQESVS